MFMKDTADYTKLFEIYHEYGIFILKTIRSASPSPGARRLVGIHAGRAPSNAQQSKQGNDTGSNRVLEAQAFCGFHGSKKADVGV